MLPKREKLQFSIIRSMKMALKLGDIAPDFSAQKELLTFTNGLVIAGEFYFPTQKTLPLYVQLSLARLLN